jgi:hypothetical protein
MTIANQNLNQVFDSTKNRPTVRKRSPAKKCNAILITGKSKGKICGSKTKHKSDFCRRHLNIKYCSTTILSGNNKGKICNIKIKGNKEACGYHSHKSVGKTCSFAILSGSRKGEICGAKIKITKIKPESECCGRHKNIVLCDAILKTGYRKGEVCSRRVKKSGNLRCGYHNHQLVSEVMSNNNNLHENDLNLSDVVDTDNTNKKLEHGTHTEIMCPETHTEIMCPDTHTEIMCPETHTEIVCPETHTEIMCPETHTEIMCPETHTEIMYHCPSPEFVYPSAESINNTININQKLADQSPITDLYINETEKFSTPSNNQQDIVSTRLNADVFDTYPHTELKTIFNEPKIMPEIIPKFLRKTNNITSLPSSNERQVVASTCSKIFDIVSPCIKTSKVVTAVKTPDAVIVRSEPSKVVTTCSKILDVVTAQTNVVPTFADVSTESNNMPNSHNENCDNPSICDSKNLFAFMKDLGWTREQFEEISKAHAEKTGNNSAMSLEDLKAFHSGQFLELCEQQAISNKFFDEFLASVEKDRDITVRNLIDNHKTYKTVTETFTNRKKKISEIEQKYGAPVSELYCDKLEMLSKKFFEGLGPFRHIKFFKTLKEKVINLIDNITKIVDLDRLHSVSTKLIQSGNIPGYLYKHLVNDCYKLPVPLEQQLLKLSSQTKKDKILLRLSKCLPFTIATYAIITAELNITYKVTVLPKDKVCSSTSFCDLFQQKSKKKQKNKPKKKNHKHNRK